MGDADSGWSGRAAGYASYGPDGGMVIEDGDDPQRREGGSSGGDGGGGGDAMDTEVPADAEDGRSGGEDPWEGNETRPSSERPVYKLSVRLIDTYKLINKRYYEEKARRQQQASAGQGSRQGGVHNGGYDDEHYDYIVLEDEEFQERYVVKETIGRGSFGKVYKAWDNQTQDYVALKIIKSKRPFMMQARTEIQILQRLGQKDPQGDCNCARLLDAFVHRNHQCLVFEMLSFNLYELLRSTQFMGVSLHLVRKFARHILKALEFLARPDVDVIHCDLKPENILLQHPKRSYIKVIDFGSSCRGDHRMYSYIQSRFYRSPEVMLGLQYTCAIDMWSLGCILVELHTGEPLFAGSDQFDQMCRVIGTLGMAPDHVIEASPQHYRTQFFELTPPPPPAAMPSVALQQGASAGSATGQNRSYDLRRNARGGGGGSGAGGRGRRGNRNGNRRGGNGSGGSNSSGGNSGGVVGDMSYAAVVQQQQQQRAQPPAAAAAAASAARYYESNGRFQLRRYMLERRLKAQGSAAATDATQQLAEILGADTGGPQGRRRGQAGHDSATYALFLDLVTRMLSFDPVARINPTEALQHPFLEEEPPPQVVQPPLPPPPTEPPQQPPPAHLAAAAAAHGGKFGGSAAAQPASTALGSASGAGGGGNYEVQQLQQPGPGVLSGNHGVGVVMQLQQQQQHEQQQQQQLGSAMDALASSREASQLQLATNATTGTAAAAAAAAGPWFAGSVALGAPSAPANYPIGGSAGAAASPGVAAMLSRPRSAPGRHGGAARTPVDANVNSSSSNAGFASGFAGFETPRGRGAMPAALAAAAAGGTAPWPLPAGSSGTGGSRAGGAAAAAGAAASPWDQARVMHAANCEAAAVALLPAAAAGSGPAKAGAHAR